MSLAYSIRPHTLLFRDTPEHIDFHIRHGDYFAFLATMMGMVEESLQKCDSTVMTEKERALAHELRSDLRYVHSNYKIEPRKDGEKVPLRNGNVLRGK